MKKLLTLLLSFILLLVCVPLEVFAWSYDDEVYGDWRYVIRGDEVTLTRYESNKENIVIPETIRGYPVTAICFEYIFATSLTVPATIRAATLTGHPETGYGRIKELHISDLEAWCIGDHTDYDTLSLTEISEKLFVNGVEVTDLVIPKGVTNIAEHAFAGLTFDSITIPATVVTVGEGAFDSCTDLYISNIWDFCSYENVPTLNEGGTVYYNGAPLTELVIPDGVTSVVNFRDMKCITKVTIPHSVTRIAESAFHSCSALESATIGNGVTRLPRYAFKNCSALKTVSITKNVSYIDVDAFLGCDNITDVYFAGTEQDRENLGIDYGNESLLNATWHCAPFVEESEEVELPEEDDSIENDPETDNDPQVEGDKNVEKATRKSEGANETYFLWGWVGISFGVGVLLGAGVVLLLKKKTSV